MIDMPQVGKKKFPYTPAGIRKAKEAAKNGMSDQEIFKELSNRAMREQPYGKVGRVNVTKDKDGFFVTEYYKSADSETPFAQERTRGLGKNKQGKKSMLKGYGK